MNKFWKTTIVEKIIKVESDKVPQKDDLKPNALNDRPYRAWQENF